MQRDGDEVQLETDEARAGETRGSMRWVLGISLLAAIILLSAVWMFGAWTQDDGESEITATGKAMAEDDGADTDGILSENFDEIEGTGDTETPGTIAN